MKPPNRISAYTRWPLSPVARIERAQTDIEFATVMAKLFGSDRETAEIVLRAFYKKCQAKSELAQTNKEIF